MAEGQYVLAPAQPAFDQLAQNSQAIRRAVAAPVNDAQAALFSTLGSSEKQGDGFVCFMTVHAVQVDVALDCPAATPQIAQDVAWQSRAQKRVGITQIEQVVDLQRSVQRFDDGSGFVKFMLAGAWRRFRWCHDDTVAVAEWRGAVDRRAKRGEIIVNWGRFAGGSPKHASWRSSEHAFH